MRRWLGFDAMCVAKVYGHPRQDGLERCLCKITSVAIDLLLTISFAVPVHLRTTTIEFRYLYGAFAAFVVLDLGRRTANTVCDSSDCANMLPP